MAYIFLPVVEYGVTEISKEKKIGLFSFSPSVLPADMLFLK